MIILFYLTGKMPALLKTGNNLHFLIVSKHLKRTILQTIGRKERSQDSNNNETSKQQQK